MYGLFCYVGGLKLLLPLSSTQYACGGRRHDDAFLTQMASAKVKAHVWWHLWHSGFAIEKQKTRTLYSFLTNDPSWKQKKKVRKMKEMKFWPFINVRLLCMTHGCRPYKNVWRLSEILSKNLCPRKTKHYVSHTRGFLFKNLLSFVVETWEWMLE